MDFQQATNKTNGAAQFSHLEPAPFFVMPLQNQGTDVPQLVFICFVLLYFIGSSVSVPFSADQSQLFQPFLSGL